MVSLAAATDDEDDDDDADDDAEELPLLVGSRKSSVDD